MDSISNSYETALVTGAAGFIGSHLAEKLTDHQVRVIALDNLSSGDRNNIGNTRVEFVHGDVRDSELVDALVKKSSIVFHLAEYIPQSRDYGVGHVIKYSTENPLLDFDVGCRASLILLEKCRKYKKKMVLASSAAVYGRSASALLKEETPKLPSSPYGASKLCAEIYLTLYSRLYDLPTAVVRFFNVYGPRQSKYLMYDMLCKLTKSPERIELLGTGQEERDFVFVEDAVDATILVANNQDRIGEVFNVGTGTATSTESVAEQILGILGIHADVKFTQTSWKGDINRLVADAAKIRSIGFEPRYDMKDGLRELVRWYVDNHKVSWPRAPQGR